MSTIRATGKVRWFSQLKGYGFLDVEEIKGDVFIHFSLIDSLGLKELQPMDEMDCDIEYNNKGYHVKKIHNIIPVKRSSENVDEEVECKLKWYNPAKGYGFAEHSDGQDIFIHGSLLKASNLLEIQSGTRLIARICVQKRGYEALSIRLAD